MNNTSEFVENCEGSSEVGAMDSAEKGESANPTIQNGTEEDQAYYRDPPFKRNKTWVKKETKPVPIAPQFFDPRKVTYYDPETDGNFEYKSRPHRKHRFLRFLPADLTSQIVVPPAPKVLLLDIFNISWWVAVIFCVGTACWVVSGHFWMWPLADESKNAYIMGYLELMGIALFIFGSYLLVLESLNQDENLTCGMTVTDLMEDEELDTSQEKLEGKQMADYKLDKAELCRRKKKDYAECYVRTRSMSRQFRKGLSHAYVYIPEGGDRKEGKVLEGKVSGAMATIEEGSRKTQDSLNQNADVNIATKKRVKWRYWGWDFHSVGYLAALFLFVGCIIFSIAVITGFPGVVEDSQWVVQQLLIWTTQVIGSVCFVISGLLLMLEEQDVWYLPAFHRIGWVASFFNFLGGVGFLMSAIFGYLANWKGNGTVCCQYWGAAFNAYYGNWAFMVGSAILLVEVENKDPASITDYLAAGWSWVISRKYFTSQKKI